VRFPILISLVVLLAAGCVQQTPTPEITPAPTPLPPIGLVRTDNSSIVASARIIPAQSANLALTVSGRVAERPVEVGDLAPAGALLLRLDDRAAQIALTQARAAYFRAQAQLAEAQAAPQPSALDGAQAQLDAAQARLSQLADPARPSQITAGQADLAAAQAAYQALFDGPDESARINALAALMNARAALQQAQSAYNEVSWRNDIGALPQSRQLQEASANLEAAQARYDALFAEPTADAISAARARVEQARSALDRLQAPATEAQLAEAEAQVRAAQAQVDALTEGVRNETLSVVASAVAETRALLQRAEQDLANLELRAPFTGTVTAVNVAEGEFVGAGVPVITLADLDHLQAETFDLSERDVAFVQVGEAANVLIEPLLVTVPGRVARVAPQANIIGGDVVYTVLVDLDEQPVGLRWGMSAEVTIE
jgi:multidrug efflux pump subunit AcrA (membrane-fusion protein)